MVISIYIFQVFLILLYGNNMNAFFLTSIITSIVNGLKYAINLFFWYKLNKKFRDGFKTLFLGRDTKRNA